MTKIAGGGTKYSYALPGSSDEYMTVNEPPKDFDPLKASDAELRAWGFPPRPSNAGGIEQWRELVGGFGESFVEPGCEQSKKSHVYAGEAPNAYWSGIEDIEPGNTSAWKAVIGTFYEPYNHGSCKPSATVADWVGLGGDYTGRFMQTGTELTASGSRTAWIEIYAGSYNFSYYIPSFPIESGNYIRLYAGYNQSLKIAYFYITNDHTGQTVLTEWHIGPQFYDGSSAEWIDEAPSTKTGQLPLLNYGQVNWYSNTTQNFRDEIHPIDAAYYYADVSWHGNHPTQWPGGVWNHENFTDFYSTCQ